eukprot:TRINITY_DN30961_c0_g1_i1.p1 TRINITY_DN30961_c0_g1~~TRINITY_DN30961_c0_g1_i1.p1  ORF type:complete len:147 (-),score=24.91 TRINITY_DN30961_c0_g1_i1:48-488(-)
MKFFGPQRGFLCGAMSERSRGAAEKHGGQLPARREVHLRTSLPPAALEKQIQLPAASAKTWTKTSEAYGEPFKEMMATKPSGVESKTWLNYQKTDKVDMYTSTAAVSFQNPDSMPLDMGPSGTMSAEKLNEYRDMWTKGDGDRFNR